MTKTYMLDVPPTMEQGSYKIQMSVPENETPAQYALWHYNSARAHDGLPPIRRMPAGTTYTRLYTYVIQQYTGARYGWEDVCSENDPKEARERLKEYRENQPEYPTRMIKRPR